MTDNEIIKALECCSEANNCTPCEYEPTEYQKGTVGCCNELMKNAIDLINRQKAEIERLKYQLNRLKHYDEKRDIALHSRLITSARAEAVKEYREKVAIKLAQNARSDYWHWIDDTLYEVEKEMAGEG